MVDYDWSKFQSQFLIVNACQHVSDFHLMLWILAGVQYKYNESWGESQF